MIFATSAYDCVEGADALAILTEGDEFRALGLARLERPLKAPILVDLHNIDPPDDAERAGSQCTGIGRP